MLESSRAVRAVASDVLRAVNVQRTRPRNHFPGVKGRLINSTRPGLSTNTAGFGDVLGIVLLILESTHFPGVKGHNLWSSLGGVSELVLGTAGFRLLDYVCRTPVEVDDWSFLMQAG